MRVVLTGAEGQYAGWTFPLQPGRTAIGRENDNDVVLKDGRVSRYHAEIRGDGTTYAIYDLGSRNGTLVNDIPANGVILRQNDRLTFGGLTFVFHFDDPLAISTGPLERFSPPPHQEPSYVSPSIPPPRQSNNSGWLLAVLGGLVACACLGLMLASGIIVFRLRSDTGRSIIAPPRATVVAGVRRTADRDLLYTDPNERYTILWPEGWTIEERGTETLLESPFATRILIKPAGDNKTPATAIQEEVARLRQVYRVGTVSIPKDAKVNGTTGRRVALDAQEGTTNLSITLFALEGSGRSVYLINITTPRETLADTDAILGRILAGLSIH